MSEPLWDERMRAAEEAYHAELLRPEAMALEAKYFTPEARAAHLRKWSGHWSDPANVERRRRIFGADNGTWTDWKEPVEIGFGPYEPRE